LGYYAAAPDDIFDLFADGWAVQIMAHLSRLTGSSLGLPPFESDVDDHAGRIVEGR
jgi:hypothetical protein